MLDKKHDHIISEALSDIQAYESFYENFQKFSLSFHFLTPKERDLHCSHDIMLRTKQTHTYTYYRFYKTTLIYTQHHDNLTTDFNLLIPNIPHHFSYISHTVLKTLTFKASSAIMTLLPKCIYSVLSPRPSTMKNPDPSSSRTSSFNL